MNILHLRCDFRDNGPSTQSISIGLEQKRQGHNVYYAGNEHLFSNLISKAGLKFSPLRNLGREYRSIKNIVVSVLSVRKLLKLRRIDVIHAHDATCHYVGFFAKLFFRRKIVLCQSVRGMEIRKFFKWRNFVYYYPPGRLLAVCRYTKSELDKICFAQNKTFVAFNGVDCTKFNIQKKSLYRNEIRTELSIPTDTIVIGIIGVIGYKGHDELIKALSACKILRGKIKCIIVGDGPKLKNFKKLARDLEVDDLCIFTGVRHDSYKLHAAFDIFVLASYKGEMFPNVLLEAMAYSNPIIATDIAGVFEICKPQNGILIKQKDTIQLAESIIKLTLDSKLRYDLGINGYKILTEQFDIKQTVKRILDIYNEQ